MNEEEFTILYKKHRLNKDRLTFVLTPVYVVSGFYDGTIFLDSLNNEFMAYDDINIINSTDEYCVGKIYNQSELINKYGYGGNLENAKINLLKEEKKKLILAIEGVNRIDIESIEKDSLIPNEEQSTKDKSILKEVARNDDETIFTQKDIDDIAAAKKYYEEISGNIGLEACLVSKEQLNELINTDNIVKAITLLNNIIKKKYSYYVKNSNKLKFLIIGENYLKYIKDNSSLEEIKNIMKALVYIFDEEVFDSNEIKAINRLNQLKYYGSTIYDTLMNIISVEDMKDNLKYLISLFDKNKCTSKVHCDYVKYEIEELKKIYELEDLYKMKTMYKKVYDETLHFYYAIAEYENNVSFKDIDNIDAKIEILYNVYGISSPSKEYQEIAQKNIENSDKDNINDYKFDYVNVHNQMVKKIIGRDSQIASILSTLDRNDNIDEPSKRNAAIIAGSTGTGKTQTFIELAKALSKNRPVCIVDTNQLTKAGYVGGTIEGNIIMPLIIDSHRINKLNGQVENTITKRDIELAKHGIVILDEIDKRATSKEDGGSDINSGAVIDQLLKLMDSGTVFNITIEKNIKQFDTSNLSILASGAFQEYFDSLEKSSSKLGFRHEEESIEKTDKFLKYNEVDPEELVKYGLSSQFIGRFSKVILYPKHTKESLLQLENNKSTSNIQAEVDFYKKKNIKLVWEPGYLEAIVEKAYELKTGGRALSNMINRSLTNLQCEVTIRPNMFKAIYIPISAIEDSGNVILVKQNNEVTSLKILCDETKEKNIKLKNSNKIEFDNDTYELVLSLCQNSNDESKQSKIKLKSI